MITKQQDIQENWKHTMELGRTTGGQDYGRLWKTMCKVAELVNNSKLTDHCLTWPT
jgi:hypothetical protein